jgi:hypothetical protein
MNQEDFITVERREYEALLVKSAHLENRKRQTFWNRFIQRSAMILVILMMVGIMGTGAWGRMIALWGYYDGKTYNKHIDQIQMIYVSGVVDGISYAVATKNMGELSAFNNFVHERPALEIKGITDRYMKAHPDEWQDPMASIIFEAVMTHFKELN